MILAQSSQPEPVYPDGPPSGVAVPDAGATAADKPADSGVKEKAKEQESGGPANEEDEKEAFEAARDLGSLEGWEAFLNNFPKGFRADLGRAYVKRLKSKAEPAPAAEEAQPAPPSPEVTESPAPAAAEASHAEQEKEAFEAARDVGTLGGWEAFLNNFPKGFRADLARAYVKRLKSEAEPAPAAEEAQPEPPSPEVTESPAAEASHAEQEKEAFKAARDLGTVEAWDAFLNAYPKGFHADLARAYLEKLGNTAPEFPASSETDELPPPSPAAAVAPSPPDISLAMTSQGACSGGQSCFYTVTATNTGGEPFSGDLFIATTLAPGGAELQGTGTPPFSCEGLGGGAICSTGGAYIPPGQSITEPMTFTLPRNAGGQVTACASIAWGGMPFGLGAREVQRKLNELGFDAGPADGQPGRQTVAAVKAYQASAGLQPSGQLDLPLFLSLFAPPGEGDANPVDDQACAGAAVTSAPPLPAAYQEPAQPACPPGQIIRTNGQCGCPSSVPVWTGTSCIPHLTRNCSRGRVYSKRQKLCVCPRSKPYWYNNRCHAQFDDCPGDSMRVGDKCLKQNDPGFAALPRPAGPNLNAGCPPNTTRIGNSCVAINLAPLFNFGNKPKGGRGGNQTLGGGKGGGGGHNAGFNQGGPGGQKGFTGGRGGGGTGGAPQAATQTPTQQPQQPPKTGVTKPVSCPTHFAIFKALGNKCVDTAVWNQELAKCGASNNCGTMTTSGQCPAPLVYGGGLRCVCPAGQVWKGKNPVGIPWSRSNGNCVAQGGVAQGGSAQPKLPPTLSKQQPQSPATKFCAPGQASKVRNNFVCQCPPNQRFACPSGEVTVCQATPCAQPNATSGDWTPAAGGKCPAGKELINRSGRLFCANKQSCPPGQKLIRITGVQFCETPGQIAAENAKRKAGCDQVPSCAFPAVDRNCPSPLWKWEGLCVCPSGKTWNGTTCVATGGGQPKLPPTLTKQQPQNPATKFCAPGQASKVRNNFVCQCPPNQRFACPSGEVTVCQATPCAQPKQTVNCTNGATKSGAGCTCQWGQKLVVLSQSRSPNGDTTIAYGCQQVATPGVKCAAGMVNRGNKCVSLPKPGSATTKEVFCQPGSGLVPQNGKCGCPPGKRWTGKVCAAQPPQKPATKFCVPGQASRVGNNFICQCPSNRRFACRSGQITLCQATPCGQPKQQQQQPKPVQQQPKQQPKKPATKFCVPGQASRVGNNFICQCPSSRRFACRSGQITLCQATPCGQPKQQPKQQQIQQQPQKKQHQKKKQNQQFNLTPQQQKQLQQLFKSDIRLKRDVRHVATLANGIKLYSFRYLWSETVHVGVMAQDLLADPAWREAVVLEPDGFYAVDYARLGLRMATLAEWQAQGLASVELNAAHRDVGQISVSHTQSVFRPDR